jgi:hypothetical protein
MRPPLVSYQPRRAASMEAKAMLIFFIVIIASKTRIG